MKDDAQPTSMAWRRLPADRRRKLAVLIGRLARRRLEASAGVTEDSHCDPPVPSSRR